MLIVACEWTYFCQQWKCRRTDVEDKETDNVKWTATEQMHRRKERTQWKTIARRHWRK